LNVQASVWAASTLKVTLVNHSDAHFQLRNLSDHIIVKHGPVIEVVPNGTTVIEFHLAEQPKDFEMKFEVMNTLVAPGKSANIEFDIQMETLGSE
jgi:intracellular sulfur oxidation DsrE/DsrF family protein